MEIEIKDASKLLTRALQADQLKVESEEKVVEMILNWLTDHSESDKTVIRLLSCVRLSAIHVDYIINLMENTSLRDLDPVVQFLCNVVVYIMHAKQFRGLRTFLRPSTGYEKCLVYLSGRKYNSKLFGVKLQQPGCPMRFDLRQPREPMQRNYSRACALNPDRSHASRFFVTGIGKEMNEIWMYDVSSKVGWKNCGYMVVGRGYHSSVIVGTGLYTCGEVEWRSVSSFGISDISEIPHLFEFELASSFELFDMSGYSNESRFCGSPCVPVADAACIRYGTTIYLFGGRDMKCKKVDIVQAFETVEKKSIMVPTTIPFPQADSTALLWDKWVVLFNNHNCYLYNIIGNTWLVRDEFRTGVFHFGAALEDQKIFIIGGTSRIKHKNWETTETESGEIRSVDVKRIIKGDPPYVWNKHGNLPQPCGDVRAFAVMTLPIQ